MDLPTRIRFLHRLNQKQQHVEPALSQDNLHLSEQDSQSQVSKNQVNSESFLRSELLPPIDRLHNINHSVLQEEHLESAYQSLVQLKTICSDAHSKIQEGSQVIDETIDTVTAVDADLQKALKRMNQFLARGSNLYIYLSMLFALLTFFIMALFVQWSLKLD
eukprot:gene1464-4623_t